MSIATMSIDHNSNKRFALFTWSSYFTPYNRLTYYSLQVHKLTKSSTHLLFWPPGFILPPNDWKLTDIFFPIWTLWARCERRAVEKIQVNQRQEKEEEKRKWKQNYFLMVEFSNKFSQNVWIFVHNLISFGKKIGLWEWISTIWLRGGLAKMSCQKLFSE